MKMTFQATVSAVAVAFLTAVSSASAGIDLQGSFGFAPWADNSASYSGNSLKLAGQNSVNSVAGDFVGLIPLQTTPSLILTRLTADTDLISGIGTAPTAISISDFLVVGSVLTGFGAGGTTPIDRFHFDLESIQKLGANSFAGSGRLRDVTGVYSDMIASFTLGFSGAYNYSASFATFTPIPEASTLWSGAGILVFGLGVGLRRLRRQAAA